MDRSAFAPTGCPLLRRPNPPVDLKRALAEALAETDEPPAKRAKGDRQNPRFVAAQNGQKQESLLERLIALGKASHANHVPIAAVSDRVQRHDPTEIKDDVNIRKVEMFGFLMLKEFNSLPLETQPSAVARVVAKFVEMLSHGNLVAFTEKLALYQSNKSGADKAEAGITVGGKTGNQSEPAADKADAVAATAGRNGEATTKEEAAPEEEETESDEDEVTDEELLAPPVEAGAEGPGEVDAVEVAGTMLQKALKLPPKDWPSIWADSGRSDDKVLLELLQAPMVAPFQEDFNSRFVAELVRSSEVAPNVLERTLQAMICQIDELVRDNAAAWHTISYTFVWLFPKTTSTSWGWSSSGWTWDRWWCSVQKVLQAAGDPYRAFDILVLLLQVLEDKSSVAIKSQQVWREHGRMRQVRNLMAQWLGVEELTIPPLDSLL